MTEKLVTIATFEESITASLAKQLLDDAGIESFLIGENFSNILPLPQVAQIQLQTSQTNAPQAIEILKQSQENKEP